MASKSGRTTATAAVDIAAVEAAAAERTPIVEVLPADSGTLVAGIAEVVSAAAAAADASAAATAQWKLTMSMAPMPYVASGSCMRRRQ